MMLPALHERRLQLASSSPVAASPPSATSQLPPPVPTRYAYSADVPSRAVCEKALPSLRATLPVSPPENRTYEWEMHVDSRRHHYRDEVDRPYADYRSSSYDTQQRLGTAQYDHSDEGEHTDDVGQAPRTSTSTTNSTSNNGTKKRSRRMSNSERGKLYRSRRKGYVDSLEQEIVVLKRQVEELQRQDSSPSSRAMVPRDLSRAGTAQTVCEYFSHFEFGVPVELHGKPLPQDALARSKQQVAFLHACVDPNMSFGDKHGIQMLLEQWERYSMYHGGLHFELQGLEIVTPGKYPVVCAPATLKVRFTRTTMEQVFPHMLWNESLVQKLIGVEITYPVKNKFHFGSDGKIVRYETEVDFMTAFVDALGNVRDATLLIGNALITEQALLGPVDETDSENSSQRDGDASPASHVPSSTPVIATAGSSSSSSRIAEIGDEEEREGPTKFPYAARRVPPHGAMTHPPTYGGGGIYSELRSSSTSYDERMPVDSLRRDFHQSSAYPATWSGRGPSERGDLPGRFGSEYSNKTHRYSGYRDPLILREPGYESYVG